MITPYSDCGQELEDMLSLVAKPAEGFLTERNHLLSRMGAWVPCCLLILSFPGGFTRCRGSPVDVPLGARVSDSDIEEAIR